MSIKLKPIRERFDTILKSLNDGIVEREKHVNNAFLSALSGEAIFFLGPPGVAKSLIARRLKFAFKDATTFEYLMNRFSTPEEIFGPISIAKLRDEDKLERKVENYLPSANIAFLDEIWKAGPSIQNTLLTIINEKIFRHGTQEIKVPLIALITASNELPASGVGLEALWDRFIIRMLVNNIADKDQFSNMILNTSNLYEVNLDDKLKISMEEYNKWQDEISKIKIDEQIIEFIHYVRLQIQQYNQNEEGNEIYISDRRWKKIIKVLRTSAFINGRDYVDLMDCVLIKHMIWDNTEQIDAVEQIIREAISHFGYTVNIDYDTIVNQIDKFEDEVKTEIIIKEEKYFERTIQKHNKLGNLWLVSVKNECTIGDYNGYTHNLTPRNCYLEPEEYNNIEADKYVYLYNLKYEKLINRKIYIRKITDESINLGNDSYNCTFNFVGENKIDFETKKPHSAVVKEWNNRNKELRNEISKMEEYIKNKEDTEFKLLKLNLFIQDSYADIILNNVNEMKKELKRLYNRLDEIKDYYENIKDGENRGLNTKTEVNK